MNYKEKVTYEDITPYPHFSKRLKKKKTHSLWFK